MRILECGDSSAVHVTSSGGSIQSVQGVPAHTSDRINFEFAHAAKIEITLGDCLIRLSVKDAELLLEQLPEAIEAAVGGPEAVPA